MTGMFGGILGGVSSPVSPPPTIDSLIAPMISVIEQADPLTGVPEIVITVENLQLFNLLPPEDSTFEAGIGTATAVSNCEIMQSSAQSLVGTHSLAMIATATGAMTAQEGPYPVEPDTLYTFTAAYRAAITAENVLVSVEWYDDNGDFISASAGTTVEDSDTQWSGVTPLPQATSPSNAAQAYLLHTVANAAGPLAIPAEPTVTPTGTTGSTTWHYGITAYNPQGETPLSVVRTTTTGNATLTGSNYNAVAWAADSGATGYNVYRSPHATCADIASDFTNCAALIGAFATCADVITFVPQLRFIGTTTSTGLHDTGLTATTEIPPTMNESGETHYVDEVGLFPGVSTGWIESQGGNVQIIRSDGTYVLGASPLFPLVVDSAPDTVTITDYTAAYGLPVTYEAILVAGQLSSLPSLPSAPVIMGQAPDTVALYDRLGWAKYKDHESGVLLKWLAGIGEMVQGIDTLTVAQAVDGVIAQPWSQVFDLTRCPTAVLPWLGQFVGVRVDPMQRDDEQRYAIEQEAGFQRGTATAILAAADKYLLPGYSATLLERDTSPYHLTIEIPAAGVTGVSTYRSLWLSVPTYEDVFGDYATYAALWSSTAPIVAAVEAAIPAGLVAVITLV